MLKIIYIFEQNYAQELARINRLCMDDLRIGSNPLMRRLYEIEGANETATTNFNPMTSSQLWRYRQPLSISHMRMKLEESMASQRTNNRQLQMFLNEVFIWVYFLLRHYTLKILTRFRFYKNIRLKF